MRSFIICTVHHEKYIQSLVRKPEGKNPPGRSMNRWEVILKWSLRNRA
jgi:hypothetical protein